MSGKRKRGLRWAFAHLAGAGFVATFIGAIMLWWVDPRVFVDGTMRARLVTAGIFALLWGGGFLHAFAWRFGFCRTACPIGLYYRFMTSRTPLGLVFSESPSPCIECGACESICPVDLDPKRVGHPREDEQDHAAGVDDPDERYGDAECIRCGDCIEACRLVFGRRAGEVPPLRFGWTREADAARAGMRGVGVHDE